MWMRRPCNQRCIRFSRGQRLAGHANEIYGTCQILAINYYLNDIAIAQFAGRSPTLQTRTLKVPARTQYSVRRRVYRFIYHA